MPIAISASASSPVTLDHRCRRGWCPPPSRGCAIRASIGERRSCRSPGDLEARYGITISDRRPLVIPPNEHNRFYLQTKALKSGHYMDFTGKPHLPEQGETVRVEGMNEGVN